MDSAAARLAQAEAALHDLLIGEQVGEVAGPDGTKVKYTPANLDALRRYVDSLKGEVAAVADAPSPRRRIRVCF